MLSYMIVVYQWDNGISIVNTTTTLVMHMYGTFMEIQWAS